MTTYLYLGDGIQLFINGIQELEKALNHSMDPMSQEIQLILQIINY